MPTIKDVAKMANVSVATVSRVINNTGYVNHETEKSLKMQLLKWDMFLMSLLVHYFVKDLT